MGLFNFEHSLDSHRADIALYGIAVAVLVASTWLTTPDGHSLAACAWTLAGLASWTLAEYMLHRFVLHHVPPFKRLHAMHHQRPTALIGSPTLMTAALFGLLVFAPTQAALGLWRACALTLGMVSGYLMYTLVHHGAHRASQAMGRSRWLQRRRRWHALHHRCADQPACYGVTSGFWDHVFGTVDGAVVDRLIPPAPCSLPAGSKAARALSNRPPLRIGETVRHATEQPHDCP
jgi:sterol desaturase/sphingolipid hydroxylase (fatty acid hydroxylase superfamily)